MKIPPIDPFMVEDSFPDELNQSIHIIDYVIYQEKLTKDQAQILLPMLEDLVDELMARYNIQ
ncbi:MAG: hypothetical protein BWY21_01872 [Parcubacteria group bacterium ADurb.Bin216]|nr:MAG: hypothetical protein BWY21_01872 [Parcubacteria group bacterium ADurb.Bin216]